MQAGTRTWFGFVVLASVLFLAASRVALLDPLENAALSVAAPIESGLRSATRPVADFINNITDINRLSNENASLREENELLTAENARLTEAEQELRQLQGFLELRGIREGDVFVQASVFASEPSNALQVIAINRGSNDGIAEHMLVLSPQGSVVGTISRVLNSAAWVTLLTDQTSAISALIQESRVQGVVAGSADGTLNMEFVEETADVKEGDLVLTSGVGGRHPSGELIGQVVEVERAPQQLFQEVRVQPLADFNRLETVWILSSFVPQDSAPP